MKKLFSCLLTVILATFMASAQVVTSNGNDDSASSGSGSSGKVVQMPIVSDVMLDAYAYSLLAEAGVQLWEDNSPNGFYSAIQHKGLVGDMVALRELPGRLRPTIDLVNPEYNRVHYYVSYNGKIGNQKFWNLFYGSQSHKPISVKGGWDLPKFSVVLERSDWIPWPRKGIKDAYMVMRDENGAIIGHYHFDWDHRIDRENGILYLGSQHVNRKGELFINYDDGDGSGWKTDVIDLATGRKVSPSPVIALVSSVYFPNLQILPENSRKVIAETDEGDPYLFYVEYRQTVDVEVRVDKHPYQTVKIFVADAEDLPLGEDAWHSIDPGFHRVEAGRRLYFRFDWEPLNVTPIPYPGGGGGKG